MQDEQGIPDNAITHIQCCLNIKNGKQCQQNAKFINPKNLSLGYCGKHNKEYTNQNKDIKLTQVKGKMLCVHYNDKTKQDCTKTGIWLDIDNPYNRYCQIHYKSIVKDNPNIESQYYMFAIIIKVLKINCLNNPNIKVTRSVAVCLYRRIIANR